MKPRLGITYLRRPRRPGRRSLAGPLGALVLAGAIFSGAVVAAYAAHWPVDTVYRRGRLAVCLGRILTWTLPVVGLLGVYGAVGLIANLRRRRRRDPPQEPTP